jgi:transposase-like protein
MLYFAVDRNSNGDIHFSSLDGSNQLLIPKDRIISIQTDIITIGLFKRTPVFKVILTLTGGRIRTEYVSARVAV